MNIASLQPGKKNILFDLNDTHLKVKSKKNHYTLVLAETQATPEFKDFATKLSLAKSYNQPNNKYDGQLFFYAKNTKRGRKIKNNIIFESANFKNNKYNINFLNGSSKASDIPQRITNVTLKSDPILNYYLNDNLEDNPWESTIKADAIEESKKTAISVASDGYTGAGNGIPRIKLKHIFKGDDKGSRRPPTGYHSTIDDGGIISSKSANGEKEFRNTSSKNTQGVYETSWRFKRSNGTYSPWKSKSTMFPDDCSKNQVISSIRYAYNSPVTISGNYKQGPGGGSTPSSTDLTYLCYGTDNSPLIIQFFKNNHTGSPNDNTTLDTAFPLY